MMCDGNEKIRELKYESRRLEDDFVKKKNYLLVEVRRCCRNYPPGIFDRLRRDLTTVIGGLNDGYLVKSKVLSRLYEDLILIGVDEGVNVTLFECKKRKNVHETDTRMAKCTEDRESKRFNVCDDDSVNNEFVPISMGNATVTVSNGKCSKMFNVYDPGYCPNPFVDFVRKLMNK